MILKIPKKLLERRDQINVCDVCGLQVPECIFCTSLSASALTHLLSLTQIEGRNVVFTSADTDL